jgi:dihydroxyacetone kinase
LEEGTFVDVQQGAQKVSPFPSVEDLIARLLTLICDQNDPERAFVKFSDDDDTVLLINNYGGLSNLELGALTQETLSQLGKKMFTICIMSLADEAQNPNGE